MPEKPALSIRNVWRRLTRPRSPLAVIGSAAGIVAIAQMVGLLSLDLGRDAAGHPFQVSLINALMLQVPLYACALLAFGTLWALLLTALPRAHKVINTFGVLAAIVIVFVSEIDTGMQRFRGERVSWAQLGSYLNPDAVTGDWLGAVLDQPVGLVISLVTLCTAVALLLRVLYVALVSRDGAPTRSRAVRACAAYALGSLACYLPTQFAYQPQRDIALAPETVLVAPFFKRDAIAASYDELAWRREFRTAIDVTERGGWLSDSFPLWRNAPSGGPAFGAARESPPDIVIFFVESLRGHDVGWGFGHRSPSVTPHLDSLALESVTLPHYIASGDPSPRGFITMHSGSWEHEHDFIIANHPDIALDAIPLRLRDHGYRTYGLWGGNPSFDNQLTWGRRWYDDVAFDLPGNSLFYFRLTPDRVLMDRAIARIASHDSAHARQPLFMMIASARTHTPYELEDHPEIPADDPPSEDRQRRYDLVLRNLDAGAGRVIASLRARERWRNTVVIVVGDHSDRTNEPVDPRWRGLPTDAAVATAALVFGPRSLIGEPRQLTFPASHADLLPTILSWLGDTTAVTTLGRDLFDTTAVARREAVAINGRGYRIDRGGFTLLVDRDNPDNHFAWRSFSAPDAPPIPLTETPFATDEPQRLTRRIRYWAQLIETNRIRPPFVPR
ncbi:MAG: LTA synthase family protein [Gemmatimonas sp.]